MYGSITIDLLIGFVLLFGVTKLFGKTQISQISPFAFISALVLGELLGNAVYDMDTDIFHVSFAIILWGCLMLVEEFANQRSLRLRRIIEGTATVVIEKGKIHRKALAKNKLDINQLQMLLRKQSAFSLREVEYAILESDGTLSVLKKAADSTPTMDDVKLPLQPVNLSFVVISDGKVIPHNLQQAGITENIMQQSLVAQGYSSPEQVFIGEWNDAKGLFIDPM